MSIKSFPPDIRHNSIEALNNPTLCSAIKAATNLFTSLRQRGLSGLPFEEMRDQASMTRDHVLKNLEEFIDRFSANATRAGAVVHRAKDSEFAGNTIVNLLKDNGVRKIVKAKSMVSEEIHLNHLLEINNIEVVETDLGEYIIQLAGESPSHILGPAIHKNRKQIGGLFAEKLGLEYSEDTETLARAARELLRNHFLTADAGFSGVNFAVAESGSLAIFSNEGNGRMCTTVPPLHIALLSIEKILPTLKDLALFSQLLTRSATGQPLSSYMSLITGTRNRADSTGAAKLHIVLLDNGRSQILNSPFRDILKCIRCSACLNVCPVYAAIGGHAYDSVYPGPMGIILTNLLLGLEKAHPLLDASTLCGACDDVCPVRIPFVKLITSLREMRVDMNMSSPAENFLMTSFGVAVKNPPFFSILQKISVSALPMVRNLYKGLNMDRIPTVAEKTFRNR